MTHTRMTPAALTRLLQSLSRRCGVGAAATMDRCVNPCVCVCVWPCVMLCYAQNSVMAFHACTRFALRLLHVVKPQLALRLIKIQYAVQVEYLLCYAMAGGRARICMQLRDDPNSGDHNIYDM